MAESEVRRLGNELATMESRAKKLDELLRNPRVRPADREAHKKELASLNRRLPGARAKLKAAQVARDQKK